MPIALAVTGSALVLLVVGFLVWFLRPATRLWYLLRDIHEKLSARKNMGLDELKAIFAADVGLAHLWSEYAETLHLQKEDRDGLEVVVQVRSTIPSELYFNSQYVVDSRVRSEFFRHLPGIFTGVGIIGTFSGLIGGLAAFQGAFKVSGELGDANGAVRILLGEVRSAFYVSAAAITAAMVVTFVEKLLLAGLYKRTEQIAQDIDARFDAGAGEEYLARLVEASEDSASQSKILKDALVTELGAVLREISASQIVATREQHHTLAGAISGSISDSFSKPLADIAGTVKAASGDQSAAASRMLQDVLSSFSERMNELFGGQITGLSDLNRDTASGVREVVGTLHSLVANIERANEQSSTMMAARMAEALEAMERRQSSMNEQTSAFVAQLREIVAASHSDTTKRMQEALSVLGEEMSGMIAALRSANEQNLAGNQQREESLRSHTAAAVSSMTGSVDGAVRDMSAAASRMQDAVAAIAQVTGSSLDKLTYGADTLNKAAVNFASAGDRVTSVLAQATQIAGKLSELGGAMTSGASSLQDVVGEYRNHRDAITSVVNELRVVVEAAKREASITENILSRIEAASAKLSDAQQKADGYLAGVSGVLAESHERFATAMTKSLDRANTDFHTKLSSAVALLSNSIQEFEASLGER